MGVNNAGISVLMSLRLSTFIQEVLCSILVKSFLRQLPTHMFGQTWNGVPIKLVNGFR